ncbi:hypothetical protein EDB89DRAFT_1910910 [Lactarius sanguifluus]|nr:hypothetical protein EDB89DRAFT_1910910 [Lactarius sanguifluus]
MALNWAHDLFIYQDDLVTGYLNDEDDLLKGRQVWYQLVPAKKGGGSAVDGVDWQGLGVAVSRVLACHESAGGRVLHAMSGWRGGQQWRGIVCHVGVVWWWVGSGGLACHVGVAWWVGGGGMLGQGQKWLTCTNGLQCPGVADWQWQHVASHVRVACWGGDEWKWLACTRGQQWPAMFRLSRKKKGKKRQKTYLAALGQSPRGLKGRVWGGQTRGGSGSTGRSKVSPHACKPPEPPPFVPAPTCHPNMAHNTTAMQDGGCGQGQAGLWPNAQDMLLPSPHAPEPPEPPLFIPAPTHHPDMARNTTAMQDGGCGQGQAGLRPKCIRYAIAATLSTRVISTHPAPAHRTDMTRDTPPPLPQHSKQHPNHQPATPPPQYSTQHPTTANLPCCLNMTRNTPLTCHAASIWHARPSHHQPPCHPNTAHNTLPPTNSPPPQPNTAHQDPVNLPRCLNAACKAQPPPTPRDVNELYLQV